MCDSFKLLLLTFLVSGMILAQSNSPISVVETPFPAAGRAPVVMRGDGTVVAGARVISDSVVLSLGTASVTFSGAAVFTSATSYQCFPTDATALSAAKIVQNSGSSITVLGTGSDTIGFICVGN